MQQDDQQGILREIKTFLTKDSTFRHDDFDPSPYIIRVLKEKQSKPDIIGQTRNDLIKLENQTQALLAKAVLERADDFRKLTQTPMRYGEQLQKLKSNVASVKKKVKETKSLLQNTQKDIQQLHYQCNFNKIIYRKLKDIEGKLSQYQSASLALKNGQFLSCSVNLPHFSGQSVLQSTLALRCDNLRLTLLSRAIEEMNLFLFFTPKIVIPTQHTLLERAQEDVGDIMGSGLHQNFKHRFELFQKADCRQYLQQIWKFPSSQRRKGKVRLISDIIKGILGIGRIKQVLQSIELDCSKSIHNFLVLSQFFFLKECQSQKPHRQDDRHLKTWFFQISSASHQRFVSTILCLAGAVFRKMLVLRSILHDYDVDELKITSLNLYSLFIPQLINILKTLFFQDKRERSKKHYDYIEEEIINKLLRYQKYVLWSPVRGQLRQSLIALTTNLANKEDEIFSHIEVWPPNHLDFIDKFDREFYDLFHADFRHTLETLFYDEAVAFSVHLVDQIIESRSFLEVVVQEIRNYAQQYGKAIPEFAITIDLLASLRNYFAVKDSPKTKEQNVDGTSKTIEDKKSISNSASKLLRYTLLTISLLLFKLIQNLKSSVMSSEKIAIRYSSLLQDHRVKMSERTLTEMYTRLINPQNASHFEKNNAPQHARRNQGLGLPQNAQKTSQLLESKLIERLSVLKLQLQMLFSYLLRSYPQIAWAKDDQTIKDHLRTIQALTFLDFDDNVQARLVRLWDALPTDDRDVFVFMAAVIHYFFDVYLNVATFLFLEIGHH